MTLLHRAAEQEDVGHLTVHGDRRGVGRGDDEQFGDEALAYELAKAVSLRGFGFDGEDQAHGHCRTAQERTALHVWFGLTNNRPRGVGSSGRMEG